MHCGICALAQIMKGVGSMNENAIKGYVVPDGFMGLVKGKYQLFASGTEYYEYMLENKEV